MDAPVDVAMYAQVWHLIIVGLGTVISAVIPTFIFFNKLTNKITQVDGSVEDMNNRINKMEKELEIQKDKASDLRIDIELIKKDLSYTKDAVDNMNSKLDKFIEKVDKEMIIHQSCQNYQEAKRKLQ